MAFGVFLVTMGMILALLFVAIGVCIGGMMDEDDGCDDGTDEVLLHRRSDMLSDGDNRDRDRSSLVGDISPEEISIVLLNLRIGASPHEKEIIDFLLKKEGVE